MRFGTESIFFRMFLILAICCIDALRMLATRVGGRDARCQAEAIRKSGNRILGDLSCRRPGVL